MSALLLAGVQIRGSGEKEKALEIRAFSSESSA
jgi:hypothetical protein